MKKLFSMQAWRIDALGNSTDITSEFYSEDLKLKIIGTIRGERIFHGEVDSTGLIYERLTSAVMHIDGSMEFNIYETNEQYMADKNRHPFPTGHFFNF